MESVMYHDYRQQPLSSDAARDQYRQYLARLEAMIAEQEDVVRQGVVDALAAHEQRHAAVQ